VWDPLFDQAATTEEILTTLNRIAVDSRGDDVVLIYLAGHGQVDFGDEMFYFASANSLSKQMTSTGLNTAMLADVLREMNARRVILLVDACEAGGTIEAFERVAETKAAIEIVRETSEIGSRSAGIGIDIVAATMPLSFASGKRESAFSSALIDALNSGPPPLQIREVIKIIQRSLPLISAQMFEQFRQTPLVASIGLDFPILEPPK
jgi:hypoxanthine-guanine phosphoribosyltransferase